MRQPVTSQDVGCRLTHQLHWMLSRKWFSSHLRGSCVNCLSKPLCLLRTVHSWMAPVCRPSCACSPVRISMPLNTWPYAPLPSSSPSLNLSVSFLLLLLLCRGEERMVLVVEAYRLPVVLLLVLTLRLDKLRESMMLAEMTESIAGSPPVWLCCQGRLYSPQLGAMAPAWQ